MYSFRNDYSEGAHPDILGALVETNLQQEDGYGEDRFCREAADRIRQLIHHQDADIHFLTGGTQTNLTAIGAFLRPHEAVVSASTGHIHVHETGAIEATGHKIIAMPDKEGKLTPEALRLAVDTHTDEHMVKPALVYISQSTELGSVYTREELLALRAQCDRFGLHILMDGARLGASLCADNSTLSFSDLPGLLDAFYIGGTKNGALIGEALVIVKPEWKRDFRFHMKQRGALLAKGRLLGIQFRELFRDGLYFRLATHANLQAKKLRMGLEEMGYGFLTDSHTNQIFPVLPNRVITALEKSFGFYVWAPVSEESSAIRLVTSWATTDEAVNAFITKAGSAGKAT